MCIGDPVKLNYLPGCSFITHSCHTGAVSARFKGVTNDPWWLSLFNPPPGLLEISPVDRGVVTLRGLISGLFIAMTDKGKLYGSVSTDKEGEGRREPEHTEFWPRQDERERT